MTTQEQLEEAQARVAALQAETSGLSEQMRHVLVAGKKGRYLDLMVRGGAIPHELDSLEPEVRGLR